MFVLARYHQIYDWNYLKTFGLLVQINPIFSSLLIRRVCKIVISCCFAPWDKITLTKNVINGKFGNLSKKEFEIIILFPNVCSMLDTVKSVKMLLMLHVRVIFCCRYIMHHQNLLKRQYFTRQTRKETAANGKHRCHKKLRSNKIIR